MSHLKAIAKPSTFVCPDCTGSLWEINASRPRRYRCHTGHAFTLRTLERAQHESVDVAVWTALRSLQEKEVLLRNMAEAARLDGQTDEARRCTEQASEVARTAASLRHLLEAVPNLESGDLE